MTEKADGKGHIDVTADPAETTYNFKNTYETEGDITFSGTKELKNRPLKAGEFTFELYEGDGTEPIQTVTNAADGSYSFTKIAYTGEDLGKDTEGNYNKTATKTYKVVEKDGGKKIDGVTYDGKAYEITVTLTDDGKGRTRTRPRETSPLAEQRRWRTANSRKASSALSCMKSTARTRHSRRR